MDSVDKKILYFLLKDGRTPQRQIAKNIGISAQTLNYRMSKMIEEGIIKEFGVRVNPSLYGKVEGYAAFVSENELENDFSLRLRCLEKITLYGFIGSNDQDVNKKIDNASKELGQPVMKYMPRLNPYGGNSKSIDDKIINQLKKTPRAKLSEISKEIDVPVIRIKRRYNFLSKTKIISVVTKIDLSKTDVVLFSIFSKSPDITGNVLEDATIIRIADSNSGVFVCFAENMVEARNMINAVRITEKDSEVMVIYDYDLLLN